MDLIITGKTRRLELRYLQYSSSSNKTDIGKQSQPAKAPRILGIIILFLRLIILLISSRKSCLRILDHSPLHVHQ